jgi:glycine cleavage system regulatory protein
MEHVLSELARDRQRTILAVAEAERDRRRARQHSRLSRLADRADRQLASRWDQAARLRAHLRELESTS